MRFLWSWFYHSYLFSVFFQSFIIFTVVGKYTNNVDISYWLRDTLAVLGGNNRPNTGQVHQMHHFSIFQRKSILCACKSSKKIFMQLDKIIRSFIVTVDAVTTVIAVFLYLVQVGRRLYETLFVCVYSVGIIAIISTSIKFIY